LLLTAAGCRGQTSEQPPIWLMRDMFHQQRFNPQAESAFFGDRRSQRQPVAGTVPREGYLDDPRVAQGREPDGSGYVLSTPDGVVAAAGGMAKLLDRGRDRYGIYCTPCHGALGDGNGIVYVRAVSTKGYNFAQPANYHDERIRHMPDGQMFATISNGVRNMAGYAAQIPVQDRWAIVAYVRALELSQAPTGAVR
jgi:mono/diheme cytochrome c family protein